ncbi:peptidylprolyl isomerase [Sphingomonas profundi]|uniref:peptidylprolyl isomerase n=1 Tax=Alterirhizorhabdus profundi TaxID=2681549 RepID=UPI0012E81641|nr:peptidylprolyl isomerase [Sphingomonas profundi]
MPRSLVVMAAALALAGAAPAPTPQQIVDRAPAAAWADVPAEDLVTITLRDGGQVVLQLAPAFAPVHVANIRAFIRAGWFDGGAIVRVQDNYVVQWAAAEGKPLPPGANPTPPAEYEGAAGGAPFRPLGYRDAYAAQTGHVAGWPVASDGRARWLVHCYGMVGVGRDNPPDTGNGAELYAVIGHAPRHLDRNIALVGRVLDGMERMAALPRGGGALGFYEKASERTPIVSTRIAADLPAAARPAWQVLDTNSAAFAQWVGARANRGDGFFVRAAGALDVCNAIPPARRKG